MYMHSTFSTPWGDIYHRLQAWSLHLATHTLRSSLWFVFGIFTMSSCSEYQAINKSTIDIIMVLVMVD